MRKMWLSEVYKAKSNKILLEREQIQKNLKIDARQSRVSNKLGKIISKGNTQKVES